MRPQRRGLEELDNFGELFLRFVHARHIGEGDRHLAASEEARPALAEAHRLGVRTLGLPHDEQQEEPEQQEREEVEQQAQPGAEAAAVLVLKAYARHALGRGREGDLLIEEDLVHLGCRTDLGAGDLRLPVGVLLPVGDRQVASIDLNLLDFPGLGRLDNAAERHAWVIVAPTEERHGDRDDRHDDQEVEKALPKPT